MPRDPYPSRFCGMIAADWGPPYRKPYNRLPETLESAARMDPYLNNVQQNIGLLLLRMPGREREALPHLILALHMDPGDANAHCNMAVGLIKNAGDKAEALSHFTNACGSIPHVRTRAASC
jgi:hypothetical protein